MAIMSGGQAVVKALMNEGIELNEWKQNNGKEFYPKNYWRR